MYEKSADRFEFQRWAAEKVEAEEAAARGDSVGDPWPAGWTAKQIETARGVGKNFRAAQRKWLGA